MQIIAPIPESRLYDLIHNSYIKHLAKHLEKHGAQAQEMLAAATQWVLNFELPPGHDQQQPQEAILIIYSPTVIVCFSIIPFFWVLVCFLSPDWGVPSVDSTSCAWQMDERPSAPASCCRRRELPTFPQPHSAQAASVVTAHLK